jgi:hypothetical protein
MQRERVDDKERPRAPVSQDALREHQNAAFDVIEVLVCPGGFLEVVDEKRK